MATNEPRCTDCGKTLEKPGTCDDCKIRNQPRRAYFAGGGLLDGQFRAGSWMPLPPVYRVPVPRDPFSGMVMRMLDLPELPGMRIDEYQLLGAVDFYQYLGRREA